MPFMQYANNNCNNPQLLATLLSEDQIALIIDVKDRCHQTYMTLGVCSSVSFILSEKIQGLKFCSGFVEEENIPKGIMCFYHCWCEFKDGTILDCTSDQFKIDGIRILTPSDDGYQAYRHANDLVMLDRTNYARRDAHGVMYPKVLS